MVLSRECYVYFALFAGLLADELLLKVVDECMGTDRKRIVLSLATLKSLSVYGTVEIDRYLISILDTSVLNSDQAGVFLSCALDLCLDIFLCNVRFCLLNLYALVLAKSNFRLNSNLCCVDEGLSFLDLLDGNSRTGNDLKSALLCSIRIACVDHFINGILVEYANTMHLLDHVERSFSFSEARDIEFTLILIIGMLYSLLKLFCRHFDCKFCRILL